MPYLDDMASAPPAFILNLEPFDSSIYRISVMLSGPPVRHEGS